MTLTGQNFVARSPSAAQVYPLDKPGHRMVSFQSGRSLGINISGNHILASHSRCESSNLDDVLDSAIAIQLHAHPSLHHIGASIIVAEEGKICQIKSYLWHDVIYQ